MPRPRTVKPGTPPDPMDLTRFAAIVRSLVPDAKTAGLILGAADEYAAHVAEETARPARYPWPPKAPFRGTGGKQETA